MGNFDASSRGGRPWPLYNFKSKQIQLNTTQPYLVWENTTEGKQRLQALVCNIHPTDTHTVTLYHVRQGVAADPSNIAFPATSLAPLEAVCSPWTFYLEGGDALWAQADLHDQINVQVAVDVET